MPHGRSLLSVVTVYYWIYSWQDQVTVNNNSPIQDYVHPDDHTQPTQDKLSIFWVV